MDMERIDLSAPNYQIKVWDIPSWGDANQDQRMHFLRQIAVTKGLDPRMATFVVGILKRAKIKPRSYRQQAACLLKWVQNNIYYVNEPRERLQDPLYTIKVGYGDCDDMVLLLASMFVSIHLPFRFVLSGRVNGKIQRWIEGEKNKKGKWSHIYLMVGYPPFKPNKWMFCEPTLNTVPLGWDIVASSKGQASPLPELGEVLSYDQETEQYAVELSQNTESGFLKHIKKELKEQLHPKRIAVVVITGAITSVLVGSLAMLIRKKILKI